MSEDKKKVLSDDAKLVFEGKIFKVYQWEQELYDGSKATFEKVRVPDSVEIIAVVDGKIIILDQEQPHTNLFVSLPGGKLDEEETMQHAAERELLEETGYQSDDILLWKDMNDGRVVLWKRAVYLARNCKKVHDGTPDAGEKIKVRFISFEEFLLLPENS